MVNRGIYKDLLEPRSRNTKNNPNRVALSIFTRFFCGDTWWPKCNVTIELSNVFDWGEVGWLI